MTQPEGDQRMTWLVYTVICRHFKKRGWMNRRLRMEKLSELTGRDINDYWDLTRAESWRVEAELRRWAYGLRRQEP